MVLLNNLSRWKIAFEGGIYLKKPILIIYPRKNFVNVSGTGNSRYNAPVMNLLKDLNPPQQAAVTTLKGPVLILAGAGSGKTRALTYRVAYMVEKGIPPEQILAVTFTNKAAEEMRHRIVHLLGPARAAALAKLTIGTFHALAARILRREIEALGFRRSFVIYDTVDQTALIKEILKDLAIDSKEFAPSAVQAAISRLKNDLVAPAEAPVQGPWQAIVRAVYAKYQERLKASNAVDFDDLLLFAGRLFRQYPAVLKRCQDIYRYILVDEYQDTNAAQYEIIKMLAQKHRNLCVVGDDYQSIYAFRGADFRNILNFEKDYPDAKIILLEQNYRSTQNILETANAIIAENRFRTDKKLWTAAPAGEPVTLAQLETEAQEAAYVVKQINAQLAAKGRALKDLAVLFRTNAQSRVLEETFLNEGLNYVLIGTVRFYERREVKDVLAYLRLLVNPADRASFQRVLNLPARGLGPAVFKTLIPKRRQVVGAEPLDPALLALLTPRQKNSVMALATLFKKLRQLAKTAKPETVIKEVLKQTGYETLLNDGTEAGEARLENVRELASVARHLKRATLEEFLERVGLFSDTDQVGKNDSVHLMTVHAAKGLEFPVVFLTGLEEGVFPHYRSLAQAAEMEEERRLCYVGVTRAREKLYLTWARRRTLYGFTQANPPSRFLFAVPPAAAAAEGEAVIAAES